MNGTPLKYITATTISHLSNPIETVDSLNNAGATTAAVSATPAYSTPALSLSATPLTSRQVLPGYIDANDSGSDVGSDIGSDVRIDIDVHRALSTPSVLNISVQDDVPDGLFDLPILYPPTNQFDTSRLVLPFLSMELGGGIGVAVSEAIYQEALPLPIVLGAAVGLISGAVCEIALNSYVENQGTLATENLESQSDLLALPPERDLELGRVCWPDAELG
jgi:hypothetical protein